MHIYVEEWDLLLGLNFRDLGLGGAILVRMNVLMLNELVISNHLIELLHSDKVVVYSILLAWPWLPCRSRYTEAELVRVLALDETNKSSFACSRRAHDYQRLVRYPGFGISASFFSSSLLIYQPGSVPDGHQIRRCGLDQTKHAKRCL